MDIKVKLDTFWTLYDHIKSDKLDYDKSVRKIGIFDDVQGFWNVYGEYPRLENIFHSKESGKPHILLPSGPREISAISLFKEDITPKWEHSANVSGGEIQYKAQVKGDIPVVNTLDQLWFDLILSCISSELYGIEYITGIRVVDNSSFNMDHMSMVLSYRFEIWYTNISDNIRENIEKDIKKKLSLTANDKFIIKLHR